MKKINPIKPTNLAPNIIGLDEFSAEEPELPEPQLRQPIIDEGEVKEFALIELGSLKIELGSCSIDCYNLADKVMKMYHSIKKDLPKSSGSSYLG